MSKGWSEERRRAQAARCRANKPWEHSTGPKTAAGKARSSANAIKHGTGKEWKRSMRRMGRLHQMMLWEYIYWTNKVKEDQLKQIHIEEKIKVAQKKVKEL